MPDWATYRLSDFLLFSPRVYRRLIELYNTDLWPLHLLALGAGLGMLALVWRRHRWAAAVLLTTSGACWLWVAWAFHLQRYASINWAATGFAAGFALQGLLLVAVAAFGARLQLHGVGQPRGATGCGLLAYALLVHPWVGVLLGRPWRQAEMFGLAPDPTVVATLGVLLLLRATAPQGRTAARVALPLLWPLPLLWCAVGGATLWTMGSADAPLLPLAASLAVVAAWRSGRNRKWGSRRA